MIVGIDLGTSTSEVAILKNGKPVLLREIAGAPHGILPSVVAIDSNGELKVGELAEKLLVPKPQLATQEVKRRMGKDEKIALGADEFTPQEISAMLLRHLKQEAEKYLGEAVTEAVITVPAHFNEVQRRATRDAGELAGLKVRRLLNEPTAAALAYGIERPGAEEKVVVYDLGGGTLDVTVLELSEGILDVLASTGDTELGGKNFDERLMQHLREACRRDTGVDLESPRLDPKRRLQLLGQLKSAAKRAKEELSSVETTQISMPFIGMESDGSPINFDHTLTRRQFEALIGDLVEGTRAQLDEALAAKGVAPSDVTTVLLVGGSTRLPLVREFVRSYFGGRSLRTDVSPDEAVALGAAVMSGIESRAIDPQDVVITDVSNWTLGVSVIGQVEGAWRSGAFTPLIERFSTIPRNAKKTFHTASDGQSGVRVEVYQGDAPLCEDNTFVGAVELDGMEPGPAGQPIEVEFAYNLSEELEVIARDLRSGRHVRATLQPTGARMSEAEKQAARQRLEKRWAAGAPNRPPAAGAPRPAAPTDPSPPTRTTGGSESWRQSPLYGSVSALMIHAEKRLAALDAQRRVGVVRLLDDMKAALAHGNERVLRAAEQRLTDLLFDLE